MTTTTKEDDDDDEAEERRRRRLVIVAEVEEMEEAFRLGRGGVEDSFVEAEAEDVVNVVDGGSGSRQKRDHP